MTTPDNLDNPIQLAVVGAAQGLKGEVRVRTFTDDPMALGDYGPLTTSGGRILTVQNIRMAKSVAVVRFAEVANRTDAEALNGAALYVDRSALPAELDEEEYYHADLIGLTVLDEAGTAIGRVSAVHDFGAGDVLEIKQTGDGPVMVPFSRAAVPEIDLVANILRLDSVAAGLAGDEGTEEVS